jgi:hypothetical protein
MVLVFAPMNSTMEFLDEHLDGNILSQNFAELEIFSENVKVEQYVCNTV